MQPPEGAQFVAEDRMRAGRALLDPAGVQGGRSEVNLSPRAFQVLLIDDERMRKRTWQSCKKSPRFGNRATTW
jgi:hypothetical protein